MDKTCLDYLNSCGGAHRWNMFFKHMQVRFAMLGVESIDDKARIYLELKDNGFTTINGEKYVCRFIKSANGKRVSKVMLTKAEDYAKRNS